jgi:hexosaminidase
LYQIETKDKNRVSINFDRVDSVSFYSKPLLIARSTTVYSSTPNNALTHTFSFNKATGKKISISKPPNPKYPGQGGAFSLVNGVFSNKGLSYPDWLGWIGDDMEATIDLGKLTSFDSVRVHTLDQNGSHVYLPAYVEVLVSKDGKKYTSAGKASEFRRDLLTMGWINVPLSKQTVRYIKVIAKNYGLIPDGKPGAGNKAWLFADEIQVY